MKIFLQNSQTTKYLRCDSNWTEDINEALDFLTVRRAVAFGIAGLKESFQVTGVEAPGLPGTVRIALSNLLWSDGPAAALGITRRDLPAEPVNTLAPMPAPVLVPVPVPARATAVRAGWQQIPVWDRQAMAAGPVSVPVRMA